MEEEQDIENESENDYHTEEVDKEALQGVVAEGFRESISVSTADGFSFSLASCSEDFVSLWTFADNLLAWNEKKEKLKKKPNYTG